MAARRLKGGNLFLQLLQKRSVWSCLFVAGVPLMTVDEYVSFNVRIVNDGVSTVSSRGSKPI